ncbi:hypothetical protein HYPSUDRAFT_186806 [Hypholoma sublateritium FD-334 SS-4]|uniref:Carboxypeptidase n=1 Tax=Hypholoma sublateritium (strain FD-334 SS-4) TaxID=945553 RepID=A0A0D2L4V8_HYPSF|nr:hypothetical protein HYPSUDRAFT_186806 [Hypholoma sublateritium FD-334 SS-4]
MCLRALLGRNSDGLRVDDFASGNGLTDHFSIAAAYNEVACTPVSAEPILSIATCVRMKQVLPRCEKMLKESCVDIFDAISCRATSLFCDSEFAQSVMASGKKPNDISQDCDSTLQYTICYPMAKYMAAYLGRPEIRVQLGVDPSIADPFPPNSVAVDSAFSVNLDEYRPTQHYVTALLERSVRALIYVGKNDWICNHVENEAWTRALEWTGHAEFSNEPLRTWNVSGVQAGMTRSTQELTFATIEGAGHTVPYDKPKESLEMVNRRLRGEPL